MSLEPRRETSRLLLLIWSVVAAAFVLVVAATIKLLGPVPPRTVVMTTGPEGGDYHQFGLRYRELLARSGVDLQLIQSNGAVENLKRLNAVQTGVSVGFVQSALTTAR